MIKFFNVFSILFFREVLIRSCWKQDPKLRPQASEIVEFLANNPRLVTPCLDVPLSSVQFEDTGQLQIHIPEKSGKRKFSVSLRNRSSNSINSQRPSLWKNVSTDDENSSVLWDQPDSPVETLPRITESWNNSDFSVRQNSVTSDNSNRVNIWDNPINNSLWTESTYNNGGVVEPLLGASDVNSASVSVTLTNRNNNDDTSNKYVPLKPALNSYCDRTVPEESDYCLHNSNVLADSVL